MWSHELLGASNLAYRLMGGRTAIRLSFPFVEALDRLLVVIVAAPGGCLRAAARTQAVAHPLRTAPLRPRRRCCDLCSRSTTATT